jgi:hypothetical protein
MAKHRPWKLTESLQLAQCDPAEQPGFATAAATVVGTKDAKQVSDLINRASSAIENFFKELGVSQTPITADKPSLVVPLLRHLEQQGLAVGDAATTAANDNGDIPPHKEDSPPQQPNRCLSEPNQVEVNSTPKETQKDLIVVYLYCDSDENHKVLVENGVNPWRQIKCHPKLSLSKIINSLLKKLPSKHRPGATDAVTLKLHLFEELDDSKAIGCKEFGGSQNWEAELGRISAEMLVSEAKSKTCHLEYSWVYNNNNKQQEQQHEGEGQSSGAAHHHQQQQAGSPSQFNFPQLPGKHAIFSDHNNNAVDDKVVKRNNNSNTKTDVKKRVTTANQKEAQQAKRHRQRTCSPPGLNNKSRKAKAKAAAPAPTRKPTSIPVPVTTTAQQLQQQQQQNALLTQLQKVKGVPVLQPIQPHAASVIPSPLDAATGLLSNPAWSPLPAFAMAPSLSPLPQQQQLQQPTFNYTDFFNENSLSLPGFKTFSNLPGEKTLMGFFDGTNLEALNPNPSSNNNNNGDKSEKGTTHIAKAAADALLAQHIEAGQAMTSRDYMDLAANGFAFQPPATNNDINDKTNNPNSNDMKPSSSKENASVGERAFASLFE